MTTVKVKAPAKINYTLEILDKRPDGYHNLKSIMQTVSLYDYLTIEVSNSLENSIVLSSSSSEIPLDKSNTVYKAIEKYLNKANLSGFKTEVNIEKNIPSQAGLAGGSSDAAAALVGLNRIFTNYLSDKELNEICAQIGSDVNFCLKGGTALCTSRGEIIEPVGFIEQDISIIKPNNFGVPTKTAYELLEQTKDKTVFNNTEKLALLMNNGKFDKTLLFNSFEKVLFDKYKELSDIKNILPNALMSGSGAAFYVLDDKIGADFDMEKYTVIEGLKTIPWAAEVIYYE